VRISLEELEERDQFADWAIKWRSFATDQAQKINPKSAAATTIKKTGTPVS